MLTPCLPSGRYVVRALLHFELHERGFDLPATPVEMVINEQTGTCFTLFAVLGPPGSPYEGGLFLLEYHWGKPGGDGSRLVFPLRG
jgi:hypothetical protein